MAQPSDEGGICTQEVTHVEEADELLELVSQVPTTKDAQSTSTAYRRYRIIVSPFSHDFSCSGHHLEMSQAHHSVAMRCMRMTIQQHLALKA